MQNNDEIKENRKEKSSSLHYLSRIRPLPTQPVRHFLLPKSSMSSSTSCSKIFIYPIVSTSVHPLQLPNVIRCEDAPYLAWRDNRMFYDDSNMTPSVGPPLRCSPSQPFCQVTSTYISAYLT